MLRGLWSGGRASGGFMDLASVCLFSASDFCVGSFVSGFFFFPLLLNYALKGCW